MSHASGSIAGGLVAGAAPAELDDRLFRTHFENLPGPAFIWRRDGDDFRLLAHNRAGAQIAEDQTGSHLGARASELYPERPDILEDLRRCADRGEIVRRETSFRFRSGRLVESVVTVVPLGADVVVAHIEDVTQQRAAGRAVEQSEARMRALFASNPDVVFRMDADARFLDLHVPEPSYFPWTREQLIGRSVAEVYGEEAHEEQVRRNRKAIATGSLEVFQYRLPLVDTVVNLESRVARAGDNEVVVSVRDVSDRVELERKLTVLGERERNRIGREIHDGLAQMLTGVKLLLENLEKRLAEEHSRHVRDASQATELVNNTIAQARELVRGLSPIPEGTTLPQALELLATQSSKYLGVTCRTSLNCRSTKLGEVAIAHLYRIAQEAITNAVRHGRATEIELSCRCNDTSLVLRVADNGSGLERRADDGEGLGLRLMSYRARAIGGEVTIMPREGGGTLVTCTCMLRELAD
ncbi:MAG TPA: PAS domain-containing protein [Gammaproteobacteria bacterium]|nr:PAS domain-containing protein [Gammaproteobacteria bacterium]